MILRPASIEDLPALAELARRSFTDAFGHLYAPEDLSAFLASWRSPERIAGYIDNPDVGVMLAEDADALIEWAIGEAQARGCDAVQLSVFSENFGAQRFYERYGFKKVADIDFWVGNHRDDEFLYELAL